MFQLKSSFDAETGTFTVTRDSPGVAEILRNRGVRAEDFDAASVHERMALLFGCEQGGQLPMDWDAMFQRYVGSGNCDKNWTVLESPLKIGYSLSDLHQASHIHGKISEEYRRDGVSWHVGHQVKRYPNGNVLINVWTQWYEITCIDHALLLKNTDSGLQFVSYLYNGFGYGLQAARERDAWEAIGNFCDCGDIDWQPAREDSVTYLPVCTPTVKLIGDNGVVHSASSAMSVKDS